MRVTRNAAASGVAIPSVSTTTTSAAPASTAVSYARSKKPRSARDESTPKKATRMPLSVAVRIASRIRSSIRSRVTSSASSLPSEIGLSITVALHPELDEHLDVGLDGARETPDLGAQPGRRDQLDRTVVVCRDSREARLDAIDAGRIERLRDLELLLRREDHADRLLSVAQRGVVQPDGRLRLGLERLLVERPRPDLRAVEGHSAPTSLSQCGA